MRSSCVVALPMPVRPHLDPEDAQRLRPAPAFTARAADDAREEMNGPARPTDETTSSLDFIS